MGAGGKPYWGYRYGQSGDPCWQQRVTTGFLCPGRGYCSFSSFSGLPRTRPGHRGAGPVCLCFASLGTALSLVSFAPMTWRALTVAQFVIAVVKISTSRGTSPTRCLLPLSIHAPVRNVLGRLVSNKKEVPYFILMHRLWRFAYLFVLPFEKLQEQSLSR